MPKTLTFTLTLDKPPTMPAIIVAGGADSDLDGTIDDNNEVAAFTRTDQLVWKRDQKVDAQTKGMKFAVNFTIGVHIPWSLVIADDAGTKLYSGASTTTHDWESVVSKLGVQP